MPATLGVDLSARKPSGSFLEKKNQKLLFRWARVAETSATAGPKVFCFFSSEKKALLSSWPSKAKLSIAGTIRFVGSRNDRTEIVAVACSQDQPSAS